MDHKEARDLVRASIARAVCEGRRNDQAVKDIAEELEIEMRRTGAPVTGKVRLVDRAKRIGRKVTFRGGKQEVPKPRVFGETFDVHLREWLRESGQGEELARKLAAIECGELATTLGAVVERFPQAFEDELLDEESRSDFRDELAYRIISIDLARNEIGRRRSLRQQAAVTSASAATSAGAAFAAADALGSGDAVAAAIGLAFGALGATVGAAVAKRPTKVSAEQGAVRGMVLSWVAALLGGMIGKRCPADSRKLQAALFEVLQETAHERSPMLDGLEDTLAGVRELRSAAADAGDTMVEQTLAELEAALRENDGPELGQETLHCLYGLVVVCELTPP